MKVLYWNRIQIFQKSEVIWFDVNEAEIIDEEFSNLFSKPVNQNKEKEQKKDKTSKKSNKPECVKLLEAKRSQQLGIIMSSKHLDGQIVRDAIIAFDNQVLSFETLNSVYDIRPQDDELKLIEDYLKSDNGNEDLLDKPEVFLLELSRIPVFEQRIYCLVYQNKFHESITSIDFRLNNINTLCDTLFQSDKVKKILGIILACGNNMNALNKTRCDADGFDLSILPKLKDVKSKDNTSNLLQYIASYYINKIDDDLTTLPLPDQSDFNFVAQVNFDEIETEIKQIQKEVIGIEKRVENVLKDSNQENSDELNEQFKIKMEKFIKIMNEDLAEQEENFKKCKLTFKKCSSAFQVKPKSGETEVTPEYFFSLWAIFCQDFKTAWKREGQVFTKMKMKKFNEKRNENKIKNKPAVKKVEKSSIKELFNKKRNEESKKKH